MIFDGFTLGAIDSLEFEQALELINLVQPHAQWSQEHFNWQYLRGPAGMAKLYVARDRTRVVSLYATVLHRMQVGSDLLCGWMTQDVMTHPDYRGRGLFYQLDRVCREELQASRGIGYGFPNDLAERTYIRNGWHDWGKVPWWSGDAASDRQFSLEPNECASFDEVATRVWEDSGLSFGVRRDAAYLNWRYSKPRQLYARFMLGDAAVLVLKLYMSQESAKVHICEVFSRSTEEGLVADLVRFATAWAHRRGALTVTAWMPRQHRYARQFETSGLRWDRASERNVIITSPPELAGFVQNPANWYLTQGDSDVY